MKNKILILVDNLDLKWERGLLKTLKDGGDFCLLTFGVSGEQLLSGLEEKHPQIKSLIKNADSREISVKAENEARDYYLHLIQDLPEKMLHKSSLLDILSDEERNLWWYLNISEKNIWADKTAARLYDLLRFLHTYEANRCDELYLLLDDNLLKQVIEDYTKTKKIKCKILNGRTKLPLFNNNYFLFSLRYCFMACRESVRLFIRSLFLKTLGIISAKKIKNDAIVFFSLYPIWWENPFSSSPHDTFFKMLPSQMAVNFPVQHLVWNMTGLSSLIKHRKELSQFIGEKQVVLLDQQLKPMDFLGISNPQIFFKISKAFRLSKTISLKMKDFDISFLVREVMINSLCHPLLFHWLLLDASLRRVNLEKAKALFFRLEFQPMERALLYNTFGKTKTIGLQHSALSKNFLNYRFSEDELGRHWRKRGEVNHLPLPDLIFTCGKLGSVYLKYAGYPDENISICGGVRFSPLFEYANRKETKERIRAKFAFPLNKTIIYVPASQLINETVSMIAAFMAAVDGDLIHLIIKGNPNKNHDPTFLQRVVGEINKGKGNVSYELSREGITHYDYLALSDAVLLTGGSAAFEAMVMGVMPIVYDHFSEFNHNPMIEYPQAAIVVYSVPSFREAMRIIRDRNALNKRMEFWAKPLADMFGTGLSTPAETFLDLVKNKYHIINDKIETPK